MYSILPTLLVTLSVAASSFAQTCPELPDTGVSIGEPVPINPSDIPRGCSKFEILVARGTSEPSFPKFGIIVGDPVVSNVSAQLAGVQGYPVQYPASSSIITGGAQGTNDIVSRLTSRAAACPDQSFALVGYSQGASIMHRAADRLPSSLYPRIKAIVMFGDPYERLSVGGQFPYALRSKVLQLCAEGDPVCDEGTCQFYHLTYIRPEWINRAVEFIVARFRG